MKALLLAVLALLAQGQQRAKDLSERVEFAAASPNGDEERKVLELLNRREHWAEAFRMVEEKFGAFPDQLVVKADFGLEGGEAGMGVGRGNEGRIRFNLKVLGDIQRKTNEIEVKRKEAQSRGGELVYKVPPAKIDRILHHELVHVLQREYKAPGWFNEGMATFLADDPNNLYGFALADKAVEAVDEPLGDPRDVYARGHLFWKWLQSRFAVKKVVELTVLERREWKVALEEATGFPWRALVFTEKQWSVGELQKYKVK